MRMQKITPFLWFDDEAEAAAEFYTSLFDNSRITNVVRYPDGAAERSGRPHGSVMTVEFELDGLRFTALNGGPYYEFSSAISFVVDCETQDEVDTLWERFTAEGEPIQCGWLRDRFGVTWQIVPRGLVDMLTDPDPEKARRVTEAMMPMKKLDLPTLRRAYEGD